MHNKFDKLSEYLSELEKQGLCLAFSGGIDSTLLLYLCRKINILAVTFKSDFQTEEEINLTKKLCKKYNVEQTIIDIDVLSNPIISKNPKDRCYHCKRMFFEKILQNAKLNNKKYVIDGTNFDDLSVYRPGRKALYELNIISPFADFKITKQEIRNFAKECGIEIFDKPSAPCLATRFPYNTTLNKEKLLIVQKGEKILKDFGFQCCRLRIHNDIARIEILDEKFGEFLHQKNKIKDALKTCGFSYITLDIEGFRSGSMDI